MRIHTWNVNGIRAVINKGFLDYIDSFSPDILCIQETKAYEEQVDIDFSNLGYPYVYWNSAEKKGYSGTCIASKIEPFEVKYGIGIQKHDNEGRVVTLDLPEFYLVNVYTPNSKRELLRLDYRYNEWDQDFLCFVVGLNKIKPVIVCGDLNVAPEEIDLTNPKTNRMSAGFTDKEREGFRNYISNGFFDAFRSLHPEAKEYTWWSYMTNARARNIGWRIDHFLVSEKIKDSVVDVCIHNQVYGSDHCPVELILR
ncbi:MAG: exodeoxyribonuclease III [Candidatus Margulisbacteria bacterium]|nr:exodeoxyribonuclease III [Candidatus Margulisiibacteriota bacterium]